MLRWLRTRDWPATMGLIRFDDDLVERIRRRVHAKVSVMQIAAKARDGAETEIEEAARWEIASVFRELHPGRDYKVRPTWPRASAILCDDGDVVVSLWFGHDYSDSGNGVSPVRTTVGWRLSVDQPKPPKVPEKSAETPVRTPVPSTAPKQGSALNRLNSRKGAR